MCFHGAVCSHLIVVEVVVEEEVYLDELQFICTEKEKQSRDSQTFLSELPSELS